MTRKHFLAGALALLFMLVNAGAALAWPDVPFAQVDVSGAGIEGAAIVTGASLGGMSIENFTEFSFPVEAPAQLGAAYELHRYFLHEDGEVWDFDRVIYYFDPAGGPGYVFYKEVIGYNPARNEGEWYRATPQALEIMRGLLTALGAWPAAAAATGGVFAPDAAPQAQPAVPQPAIAQPALGSAIAAIGLVLAVLVSLALLFRLQPIRNLAVGFAHRKLR